MTNTSEVPNGHPSELLLSSETDFAAEPATQATISKSITGDIPPSSEQRPSTTSRRSAEGRGAATKRSRTSSAGANTPTPTGYRRLTFQIRGVCPLIMHNGQLANPLNRFTKELKKVSGKRAKTESDYEELARLEFLGSLYLDGGEPCIPGEVIEAALIDSAKRMRRGNQARAGIVCAGNFPLEYDGPRSPNDLWKNEEYRFSQAVRVQRNRVIRTRPIFRNWASSISVDFMPDQLNADEVNEMARISGMFIGLCDWRPKFGRFQVET